MDYPTVLLIIWNLCVAGIMSKQWSGSLRLQKDLLIIICALFAYLIINYLPERTPWFSLAGMTIYGKYS